MKTPNFKKNPLFLRPNKNKKTLDFKNGLKLLSMTLVIDIETNLRSWWERMELRAIRKLYKMTVLRLFS